MASEGNTLGKVSRLSGKKSIATLLADGKWGSYGHFRYCWLAAAPSQEGCCSTPPAQEPAAPGVSAVHSATATHGLTQKTSVNGTDDQAAASGSERPGRILISVPKRFFKRAVKRNLLKRRIREAYRVRKLAGVDVLFQYNSTEIADFATVSAEVAAILSHICKGLTEGYSPSSQKNAHQACTLPSGATISAVGKTPEKLPEP